MTRILAGFSISIALASIAGAQSQPIPAAIGSCAQLATLALPDTTITAAAVVDAGSIEPPSGRRLDKLPPFCRVAATSAPAVKFEVWLPLRDWNGRFQGVGNGANAGAIGYDAMAAALRRGYAVASTDTGHQTANGRDAQWALERGLVNSVVPHDELMDAAMSLAREIAANPPLTVRSSKALLMRRSRLEEALPYEDDANSIGRLSEDRAEAMRAFAEKRDPVYRGR